MFSFGKRYGKRVKNAFVGAVIGVILFLVSFVILAWNERDAVRQTGAITEIQKVAVGDVPADMVESENDGKLVHIASEAHTSEKLEYPKFGVRENAIRLRWSTSIYQWEEDKRKKSNDRTVYEYKKKWVDQVVDSSNFHESSHSNEGSEKHFHDDSVQATDVAFGAFQLSKNLISQINEEQAFKLPQSIAMDVRPQGVVNDGVFYTGDPSDPQIGDEKVEVFTVGPKHDVTIMARQSSNSFAAYETRVGIPKEILYVGRLSKSEVISRQRTEAAFRRWIFRGLGFGCMWIGLSLSLSPLRAVFSFIPFVGRLIEGAVGIVSFLISVVITAIVIAIAWFVVRPILSACLLAIAGVCLFMLWRNSGGDTNDDAPQAYDDITVLN